MSRGYADVQFTGCADLPVRVHQRYVLTFGEEGCRATFADVGSDGLADLLARAFEALASAPDLTPEERTAVCKRMSEAVDREVPVHYLPADRDGETYWQRVEAEAESIGGAA